MYTESAFHHQGYEILKDLEPYMRDLTGKQIISVDMETKTKMFSDIRTFA